MASYVLLFLALIAPTPTNEPTTTVEVNGYTDTGEYVRLRGVVLDAIFTNCATGPCLDVVADQIIVAGDSMFSDGFEEPNPTQ